MGQADVYEHISFIISETMDGFGVVKDKTVEWLSWVETESPIRNATSVLKTSQSDIELPYRHSIPQTTSPLHQPSLSKSGQHTAVADTLFATPLTCWWRC